MKDITDKLVSYMAYIMALLLAILVIVFGVFRIKSTAEEHKVITAIKNTTEDPGDYVISVSKAHSNLDGTYYYVLYIDDDEDVTLYGVRVLDGKTSVFTLGVIE